MMSVVYTDIVARLSRNEWLKQLSEYANLDEHLVKLVTSVRQETVFGYDPYQYDLLINQVSSGLDRCLAYRDEFQNLFATAFRQGMDYDYFRKQAEISRSLDHASWSKVLKVLESQKQLAASAEFGKGKDAADKGFAALAKGASDLASEAAAAEEQKNKLIDSRWDQALTYQADLEAAHKSEGHALNFWDRAKRILRLLDDEFVTLLAKSFALEKGLTLVRGIALQANWRTSNSPLDDLVHAVRNAVLVMQQQASRERERHVFFIVQAKDIVRQEADVKVDWWMDDPLIYPPGRKLRVRGIAARIMNAPPLALDRPNALTMLSCSLQVIPPGDRAPVLFRNVTAAYPTASEFYSGPEIYNLPAPESEGSGVWKVRSRGFFNFDQSLPNENGNPTIEVIFNVVG